MKKLLILLFGILFIFSSCLKNAEKENPAPSLPEGNQAISLLGEALYSSQPSEGDLEKYDSAKLEYESNSGSADALIWYGRRTAYLGKYREAIKIYTEGINKFPEDARMYRHRGHRYISLREFINLVNYTFGPIQKFIFPEEPFLVLIQVQSSHSFPRIN